MMERHAQSLFRITLIIAGVAVAYFITGRLLLALGVKDLNQGLKAAQAAVANVIFSYTVEPENAVIARDRKTMGWKVPQVGAWPLSFPFFIEGIKDAAEGALMAQTFIAEPCNERRRAFLSADGRQFAAARHQ